MARVNINIPVAHFHNVLSWDKGTIDKLVQTAIDIAYKVGIRLDDDHEGIYMKEAEGKGARIDWNTRAVKFAEEDIIETIAVMKKTFPAQTPVRGLSISSGGNKEKFLVGNGANMVFDWDSWQTKAPGTSDLVGLCNWMQGCDNVGTVFAPVMMKDMDQNLEPLYNYALMCKYCRKKVLHEQPTRPIHVRYLEKMARIVEKYRGYYQSMNHFEYINPPFRLGFRSIETMLARVDMGVCNIMGIGSMAMSGMSAPVTAAGSAVTAVAEILAGLSFFRIMRPGFGLHGNVDTGNLDLRTGRASYFNMHTHLQNLAAWELMVRGIGADSPCLTWYRDANEPGMQALYEYGFSLAFFSSVLNHAGPELGGLACGNIFSPEQAVLDMEVYKEFNELAYGFEVSEDILGIKEITEGGFEQSVHMTTGHTLNYMHDNVPFSNFLFRGLSGGAHHNKNFNQTEELMEKAAEAVKADKKIGAEIDEDIELSSQLFGCVREAASELGIDCPALV